MESRYDRLYTLYFQLLDIFKKIVVRLFCNRFASIGWNGLQPADIFIGSHSVYLWPTLWVPSYIPAKEQIHDLWLRIQRMSGNQAMIKNWKTKRYPIHIVHPHYALHACLRSLRTGIFRRDKLVTSAQLRKKLLTAIIKPSRKTRAKCFLYYKTFLTFLQSTTRR